MAASQYSLGSGSLTLTNGSFAIRNDAGYTKSNAIVWSGANNVGIQVGEAINGSGVHGRPSAWEPCTSAPRARRSPSAAWAT